MRRLMAIVLCLLCLAPTASAAETKYAALILCGGPNGDNTEKLLEGLAARGAKATFFLRGERLEAEPEMAQKFAAGGHELGIEGYGGESMANLSRREIAQSFGDTRALMESRVRVLRPPEGICTDGVRQVAEVTGLALIDYRLDIRRWAARDGAASIAPAVEAVQDGDVVLLGDESPASVNTSLAMVDQLQKAGFRFVTISELARIRGVLIHPGRTYTSFPPAIKDD